MLENKLFEALLDVIPFGAYAVDVETYDIVYANKIVRENMYAPQESYCWKKIYGNDEICPWCNIFKLKDREQNSRVEQHVSTEFFDEMDDKWFRSYDELVSWPDGRDVKYSILINITDQKAIHGSMIQSHAKLAVKTKQIKKTNKNLQITKLKLQKSINEFNRLFNSTMEGMIIIENERCIDVNKKMLEMLDFENKDELLGKDIATILSNDDGIPFEEKLNDCNEKSGKCFLIDKKSNKIEATLKATQLYSEDKILLCASSIES